MDTALIALVGVIAGAILTGGVQAAAAWFDRRLAARSSARLLYMELHEANDAINELRRTPIWDRIVIDWHEFGSMWEKHREALARALGTDDFLTVAAAFSSITNLARARDMDAERPAPSPGTARHFSVPVGILDTYSGHTEAAMHVILKAAYTRREKRLGKDSLSR